jgi:hypothetical protein
MHIFVAHDFTSPPLRNFRRPFHRVGDKYSVAFMFGDDVHVADHLLEQIEAMIAKSDACLFDVTSWNRNVFLELGFARGLQKDCYLLFRPARGVMWNLGLASGFADVPVDIRGLRQLRYFRERSLRLQLDDLVSDLVSRADLSAMQDMLAARVEDLLARHASGLLIGEIAVEFSLNQAIVSGLLKFLIEQGRGRTDGYGNATRYLKSAGPLEAAKSA